MNFGLDRLAGAQKSLDCERAPANAIGVYKPRSIREQLQDQVAYHESKIADLKAACDALTPDVEKALDALQKLS